MYKIGEFSQIVDLSVRTLRYYDEISVLTPSFVDNYSGYRYYTEENIKEANLIKLLRSLGFSLEEIIMYKSSLTEDIIDKKIEETEDEIKSLETRIQKLQIIRDELQNKSIPTNNIIEFEKPKELLKKAS